VDLRAYRFRSVWSVPAEPGTVYAVLRELGEYPRWWREVRTVRRIDDDTSELVCRSFLPYDLSFVSSRAREDPFARVLEATLTGDLEGFSRWTIRPDGRNGSRMLFEEEVVTNKRSLNLLAPIARPAFTANHTLMMRSGERGLRTYLAGYQAALKG